MKIRLARTAGFCMGVRRAVEMALDLQREARIKPIVTYGPLIHNPQTLKLLNSKGISQVDSVDDIKDGTVIIRAHGISPQERSTLDSRGVTIIDATCPRVSQVQAFIRKHADRGDFCIIVGDADHPEVRGLVGFASSGALVVSGSQLENLVTSIPLHRNICVVAQTTQEPKTFNNVVSLLEACGARMKVYNTICNSTKKRQAEVDELARQADLVIVVGGKGSGNTQRLAKVASDHGKPVMHIETDDELDPFDLTGIDTVAVTAGASTPNWQIRQVIEKLKQIDRAERGDWLSRLRMLGDISVMIYGWAALGGAGLTVACLSLLSEPLTWVPPTVTALFVFSMHLLNRIQERAGAVRFNTPEIAAFYATHGQALTIIGLSSSLLAIALSFKISFLSGLMLIMMTITGLLYSVPIFTFFGFPVKHWRALKDLPGSKTPLVATGWAMAACVVPMLDFDYVPSSLAILTTFILAFTLVFWRTALSDLLDIQGDRIMGRETIPILLGATKTRKMLNYLLLLLAFLLLILGLTGLTPKVAFLLTINIGVYYLLFAFLVERHLIDRLFLEALTDGNFVLAGMISATYMLF